MHGGSTKMLKTYNEDIENLQEIVMMGGSWRR